MSRARAVHAAAASDPGRARDNNEDRVLSAPELGIFAVIDGVGGESAGEVAAETALAVLRARLSRRTTDSAKLVREAIALANRQIHERALADPKLAGMACVLTVAVLDGSRATIGHVGDSRAYALAAGTIRKLTHDHSPVGAREDSGELSESEAMSHPRRNEIFRDVGSEDHEPEEEGWIEILEVPFDPAGALLLCSDGLSDMVPSREILQAIEANAASPDAAVRALVQRANAAGGKDNVSAVLVEGDRYAEAVRRRGAGSLAGSATGGTARRPTPPTPPPAGPVAGHGSGAASVRSGWSWRSALPLAVALVALLAALAALFREPLLTLLPGLATRTGHASPAPLVVGIGDGGFATIGEALAAAQPGQSIEVAPGEYRERLTLRAGVAVVSRVPRAAILLPPAGAGTGAGGVAVAASGIRGARLSGFRIRGEVGNPWGVGVRLDGSEVVLDELEVTRAAGAGIEIGGADRSTVRYVYVHQNGGAGIVIAGAAAPRLLDNLVLSNGIRAGSPAAGIEVRETAAPLLAGNRIEGNGGGGVALPAAAAERGEEIFRWNAFGALPREQAVHAVSGASGAPPPAVARPPLAGAAAARPAAAERPGSGAAGARPPAARPR